MRPLTVLDLPILKRLGANSSLIKVRFDCLQCKEGVSGLRDSGECLKYQVAGAQVMCECSYREPRPPNNFPLRANSYIIAKNSFATTN